MQSIAILYQSKLPPANNGIQKPMKPGGYCDSGADIAFELSINGLNVVTPNANPDTNTDLDWVFPDTKNGIKNALNKGANLFWLNTVLYKNHDIEYFFNQDIQFVGQLPSQVDVYDDKFVTNEFLRTHQIPIPRTELISLRNLSGYTLTFDFPMVIKPLRGRGSQGVSLVKTKNELDIKLDELLLAKTYGNSFYVEKFLEGQEITITVMPCGTYTIYRNETTYEKPWSLPAVKRINHKYGIAPYNGVVAVMKNSSVLEIDELNSDKIIEISRQCEKAAELIGIKAPIRIDCRADEHGTYFLFDLNMKPNMTGPSRPHRHNQDSLTLMAARKIGWNYMDLLNNMLRQTWKFNHEIPK